VDDKQEQTIEKYDFEVRARHRTRGAVLLETGDGLRIMRQYEKLGEHFALENRVKEHLFEKGMRTDRVVKNKEGEEITAWESGENYVLYEWYAGSECDYRNKEHLRQASANLGKLHLALRDFTKEPVVPEENLLTRYSRHTLELKRVYAFMKTKKRKSNFELDALACYPGIAKKARDAERHLEQSAYYRKNCTGTRNLCHGEYNYHNLIMTENGVVTTNFERLHPGLQLMDFAYFFRKVMEKNNWDAQKGKIMIQTYRSVAGFSAEEREFFGIVLSYPEKYWKLMNHYINGKKTWISDKNIEKLRRVKEQEMEKEKFLQMLDS
jgi:CotS family spore coat protein